MNGGPAFLSKFLKLGLFGKIIIYFQAISFISVGFLLLIFVFTGTCESDIFTIVNNNVLQRNMKSLSSIVNTETIVNESSSSLQLRKFYLASIEELTSFSRMKNEQVQDDCLSLPSVYISLAENRLTMFHDVKYSNFFNFENSSEITETIKMGPHSGTVSITYEAKLTELILSGKAEVNGTCHDFILNITEPVLGVVYKTGNSDSLKIKPYSVSESFTFKSYYLIIESSISSENQIIESPNSQILPQLAASWLVTIFNAVKARFVRPKIMRHHHLFFQTFKDNILKNTVVSIADHIDTLSFSGITDVQKVNHDYDQIKELKFDDISVTNFHRFQDCSSSSQSLILDREGENLFSHHINLVFRKPSTVQGPTIRYSLMTNIIRNRYNGYSSHSQNENKMFNQLFIDQWSIKLRVFTDRSGRLVNENEMKSKVDFELIKFSGSVDHEQNIEQDKFIESFEKSLSESLSNQFFNMSRDATL